MYAEKEKIQKEVTTEVDERKAKQMKYFAQQKLQIKKVIFN